MRAGWIVALAWLGWATGALADKVSTFRLDNGLDVVVIEDHRAPVVVHMVWYRIGSADESPGHSGIAHFLEHLMFQGTKTVAPGDLSKIVAAQGGSDNAFTTADYTAYFQRVAVPGTIFNELQSVSGVGPAVAQQYGATILGALGPEAVPGTAEPRGPVAEALGQWRAAVAREMGVPEYVVLGDRALAALAAAPTGEEGLRAIPAGPRFRAKFEREVRRLLERVLDRPGGAD